MSQQEGRTFSCEGLESRICHGIMNLRRELPGLLANCGKDSIDDAMACERVRVALLTTALSITAGHTAALVEACADFAARFKLQPYDEGGDEVCGPLDQEPA